MSLLIFQTAKKLKLNIEKQEESLNTLKKISIEIHSCTRKMYNPV